MNEPQKSPPLVWIIIGVSGSGKTAVGRWLSEKLECAFIEGDRLHPASNVIKMIQMKPLQDKDRCSWLLEIKSDIRRAIARNRETVITCSALKASYRKKLTSSGRVQLVWLEVSKSELERRLSARNHYMKLEMLVSQIDAFEPISSGENVITINGNLPLNDVAIELMTKAIERFPSLEKPWWERCIGK